MREKIFIAMSLLIFSNIILAVNNLKTPTHFSNWKGFYLGVNGGMIFNSVHVNASQLGLADFNGICNSSAHFSNLFPGVQLGYAQQLDSHIVWGIEGDYTNYFNRAHNLRCKCPFNTDVDDQFAFHYREQTSLRFRLGYALKEHILPFFSIGGSLAGMGLNYSNESSDRYSTHKTQLGWLVGLGLEWEFRPNWSFRTEYAYMDYGKMNLHLPTIYGLYDPNGIARAKLRTNNVRIAINYWFQ